MPTSETSARRHDRMVRDERDQAERVRSDRASHDIWKPHASRFRPAPDTVEPAVAILARLAEPTGSAIDVGAGGGRIALPLARLVRRVVAVEPSAAMCDVLDAEITRSGLASIGVVRERWEDAAVDPAELVFAAHVSYGVQQIEPFLRKLDRLATRHAALVTFTDPPQQLVAPFWRAVYGEDRLRLPGRVELLDVLQELGAEPRVVELPSQQPQSLGTPDHAFDQLRRRLYIGEGNPLEARLRRAMMELTVERDGELWSREARANPMAIITWAPAGM